MRSLPVALFNTVDPCDKKNGCEGDYHNAYQVNSDLDQQNDKPILTTSPPFWEMKSPLTPNENPRLFPLTLIL